MITIVLAFIETYFIELLYRRIILGKLLKRRIIQLKKRPLFSRRFNYLSY